MNKIAIIGAGKLGTAMAKGWIKADQSSINTIILSDKRTDIQDDLLQSVIINDNLKAIQDAKYILLAVKPQHANEAMQEIAGAVQVDQIILSVMMGITTGDIKECIGKNNTVIRVMPNIAASIGESMTCLSFNADCSENVQAEVKQLFKGLGEVVTIEEQLMDAATVMTGSAIAFALRYARAMMQGGISIGFDAQTSLLLSAQVMKSAVGLMLTNKSHPEVEVDKVTTPKGCTIAGLNEMEARGLSASVIQGVVKAYERIVAAK